MGNLVILNTPELVNVNIKLYILGGVIKFD